MRQCGGVMSMVSMAAWHPQCGWHRHHRIAAHVSVALISMAWRKRISGWLMWLWRQ